MPMAAADFSWHFTPGNTFRFETGALGRLTVVPGGELWLPTGRVVASDPFISLGAGEAEPFTAEVAPGRYPVEIALVTITQPDEAAPPDGQEPAEPHERVAAARLVIKDTPTVSYELALQPGQDASQLSDDQFFGYGVDAGAGCFYDVACDESFPDCQGDEGPLWDAFDQADWSNGPHLITAPDTGHNLVAFTSGWGDGVYPTWVGRDADGAITCFVTDFFVVPSEAGA
ncbi:DUF4241 domain-containing protein [Streptomyces sp. SP18CS02]|uniref:DUF4241 domain-containing protein n=1 Tax=Streptomyces sp. SP18CS02 TaxID=3002531 RepID=UPI002E7A2A44|nr:DUF4241 domain-containing protein [Streptomyces sp. SP18CS02]MEE1756990.1 DUF4241 domain-containing protein [Streptomyces sp. SP18CS02]